MFASEPTRGNSAHIAGAITGLLIGFSVGMGTFRKVGLFVGSFKLIFFWYPKEGRGVRFKLNDESVSVMSHVVVQILIEVLFVLVFYIADANEKYQHVYGPVFSTSTGTSFGISDIYLYEIRYVIMFVLGHAVMRIL